MSRTPGPTGAPPSAYRCGHAPQLFTLTLTAAVVVACRHDDTNAGFRPAALGSEQPVCGRTGARATDDWDYRAAVTDGGGLVPRNLRFGPRLVAQQISVPYFKLTVNDEKGKPGPVHTHTLIGQAKCTAEGSRPGVSATYRVEVAAPGDRQAASFSLGQSYEFDTELDRRCEPTGTAVRRRFWPTTTWAAVSGGTPPEGPADRSPITVNVMQRFAFDLDGASAAGCGERGAGCDQHREQGRRRPPSPPGRRDRGDPGRRDSRLGEMASGGPPGGGPSQRAARPGSITTTAPPPRAAPSASTRTVRGSRTGRPPRSPLLKRTNSAAVKPFPGGPASERYPAGSWAVPVPIEPGNPTDQGPYYLRVQAISGLKALNTDPLWSAAGGGVPRARVYDHTVRATGGLTDNPDRVMTLSYDRAKGPMWAAVVFDRQPEPDEMRATW
ncbi:hypothetical protein KOI35_16910 [Actinoplanes bogorensis]|uniref:DUF1996 domain-containing protein n=1 Tax=Paractinoplanes bogorensis TaxID=1610840 RepID=A0ABS5YP03_9ACTN|nr:hypothetical protein [Actinoplanes bogorensis]MBU2665185.1 hypothetical protein [Actinoplanes bogorensis]